MYHYQSVHEAILFYESHSFRSEGFRVCWSCGLFFSFFFLSFFSFFLMNLCAQSNGEVTVYARTEHRKEEACLQARKGKAGKGTRHSKGVRKSGKE